MGTKKRLTRKSALAWAVLGTLPLVACSELGSIPNPLGMGRGVIHAEPHPRSSGAVVLKSGEPVVILLKEVTDARPGVPGRRLGDIRTTVVDLADTSLSLDEDVPGMLGKALRAQLEADGMRVVSDASAPHDFEIDVQAKVCRLDIVDRDRLDIVGGLALRDARSHEVLWAGEVGENSSRFAGVAGDSRASIAAYFDKGLNTWSGKVGATVRDGLLKSYPQTIAVTERKTPVAARIEGVTTLREAQPRDEPATAPLPPVALPATKGIFSIATIPPKAKVYIEDVYFGTTPLKLELDPGVMSLNVRLEGYKAVTEKVSIRRGETTELEVKFEN